MPRSRTLRTSALSAWRLLRVHAGGRLVEQQQLGLGRQRARDLELALLAVGQVLRELVALGPETDELEPLVGDVERLLLLALELRRAKHRAQGRRPVRVCRPTMTFSSAVMFWNRRMFWNVREMPMRAIMCVFMPPTALPSNVSVPSVGV